MLVRVFLSVFAIAAISCSDPLFAQDRAARPSSDGEPTATEEIVGDEDIEAYLAENGELAAYADEPFCDETCETYGEVFGDECGLPVGQGGFFFDLWLAQGFTWNPDNPGNRFNLPVTFNDRANEYQMNQLYLAFGKNINPNGCRWDIGGRIDLLYGTDYFFTESFGLEKGRDPAGIPHWNSRVGPRSTGAALYGLALPQAYADFFAPIGNGVTVRMGHFYSILGCESVMAPDNFFYSHSYAMQYGEPKTHTGMLAGYRLDSNITFQAGFTRGWDAWDGPNDKLKFLTGVNWTSCDRRTSIAFALHTGNEDENGDYNRTSYSLVLRQSISDRMTYVFQHDYGNEDAGAFNAAFGHTDAKWYGINQYLLYDISCSTSVGLRFEWFRDQDNARVLAIPFQSLTNGGNYWAITLGFNYKPTERITIRPEFRWDWSDVTSPTFNADGMYDDFSDKNQFTLGTDLIIRI